MNTTYLKPEERAVYALRELYRSYGYLPFKMSKFEEYDLYVRNKDFLWYGSVSWTCFTEQQLRVRKLLRESLLADWTKED